MLTDTPISRRDKEPATLPAPAPTSKAAGALRPSPARKLAPALAMLLAMTLTFVAGPALAQEYERFFGTFTGEVTVADNDKEIRRDLSVTIAPIRDGFQVTWVTTTVRTDGEQKTKSYTIDFFPSDREHIYRSAMKANLFGGREPLDPIKGDPYVWAHFVGDTLVVNALIINEEGGYEMQTYNRTLVDGGMALKFNRIRDGEPLREITATLTRVDG